MAEGKIGGRALKPESLMMSYGYNPQWSEGAIKCPIFQTSTFVFESAEDGKSFFELALGKREPGPGEPAGLIYSRLNNPDLEILEDRLTLWDKAESCAVFESGMAAISTMMLEFLQPGDLIVHCDPVYGGTQHLLKRILPRYGIKVVPFKATTPIEEVETLILKSGHADGLKMIYLETPTNPSNEIIDIAAHARLARSRSKGDRQVLVAVDNTFLGPVWQHPLEQGADLVLYSATKFIGGHSDVIAGVCLGRKELMDRIRVFRTFLGTMADPWTGWLLMRSLETLKLRMTSQMKNARYVADFLNDHPKVDRVHYLGLLSEDDPQYEIYRKQCLSPGSMISFEIHGGEKEAFRFLNALEMVKLAVSLGGTESLAEHPSTMTHAEFDDEDKEAFGITESMIRLSVGIENSEDIVEDLKQALEVI